MKTSRILFSGEANDRPQPRGWLGVDGLLRTGALLYRAGQ